MDHADCQTARNVHGHGDGVFGAESCVVQTLVGADEDEDTVRRAEHARYFSRASGGGESFAVAELAVPR